MFELVAVPILPLFLVTRHLEFHCSHCPSRKYLHSKCAPAVGRGLRTKQPTGTRDSVHTARDLREVCFCRYERRVPFMAMFFQRLWQWLLFALHKRSGLCSASARHNRTIRTHRSCCCLWPSTFAFAVCVTVLERTTIALRCSRCTTSQCTLGYLY